MGHGKASNITERDEDKQRCLNAGGRGAGGRARKLGERDTNEHAITHTNAHFYQLSGRRYG